MSDLLQQVKALCEQKKLMAFFSAIEAFETTKDSVEYSSLEKIHQALVMQKEYDSDLKVERIRRNAKLRWPQATLNDFKGEKGLPVSWQKLQQIAEGSWVREHCHLILTGFTGVGKTYLACAISQEIMLQEYSLEYHHFNDLIRKLVIAEKAGGEELDKLYKKLKKCHVLFIDDWGIKPLNPQARHLLFELIEMRDQSSSLIITSQYDPLDWYDAFADKTIADSTFDRITNYAMHLSWEKESYRKEIGGKLVKKFLGGNKNGNG